MPINDVLQAMLASGQTRGWNRGGSGFGRSPGGLGVYTPPPSARPTDPYYPGGGVGIATPGSAMPVDPYHVPAPTPYGGDAQIPRRFGPMPGEGPGTPISYGGDAQIPRRFTPVAPNPSPPISTGGITPLPRGETFTGAGLSNSFKPLPGGEQMTSPISNSFKQPYGSMAFKRFF